MNIKILCVGKVKESAISEAINEYAKRISKYANFEIIEVSDEVIPANPSEKDIENIKRLEADKLRKHIKSSDYTIALDLRGTQLTSEELAEKIQNITVNGYSTINFIIGGTAGLDSELVKNCHYRLSFSKLTFPHQLIRLFLSEQIFRSFKIINNEKYHW
ncbi:MAG: 23S rRNA (pseudouridine(1915)-N(3))-methyltransferase RlmH [Clostridia bacterium]|nr:23S rRNA (pseudouridine(1915)-N(3))-methyltransferase RlmH [Clostridia bacterium]